MHERAASERLAQALEWLAPKGAELLEDLTAPEG